MTVKFRTILVAATIAPLTLVVASPAFASMSKLETLTCPNQYQGVRSKTTLDTYVNPAGNGDAWYFPTNSAVFVKNTYAFSKGGGEWYVWADGIIKPAGTYASCYSSLP